ncbi:hypothetical protein CPB85DRAFT_638896 [Mucidula mucida]|nr:hypothetical protein CPB85DRAFT_638896 [Mucidula mucida]
MSLSVDDLVSSFSSSHIGQEAMDLAALQAQLSQALFTQQIPKESYSPHRCNTPTSRTPSSSFSWGQAMDAHRRQSADEFMRDSDDMEDERMVEDLLVPSSPGGSKTRKSASDSSLFTSTDPFYIAQLQAMQQNAPPQSVFTQFGRPSQHSPFQNAQQQQQQQCFQQPRDSFASQSISIDTHSYLFATSAAFER